MSIKFNLLIVKFGLISPCRFNIKSIIPIKSEDNSLKTGWHEKLNIILLVITNLIIFSLLGNIIVFLRKKFSSWDPIKFYRNKLWVISTPGAECVWEELKNISVISNLKFLYK